MHARAFKAGLRKLLGILLLWLWAMPGLGAEPPELSALQYRVKAGFLYNFAKLTDWPSNTFATADAPFVIGVVGKDPFGASLEETLRGKSVLERKIVIRRFETIHDMDGCQVLFISASESERLAPILARVAKQPTLTVSDLDHFASKGGMIGLLAPGQTKKFEANLPAVEHAGLRLDSRLRQLAAILPPEAGKKEKQ
jgi:hypothetical protein